MIFDGIDDIPWGELTYAYDGDCDVPALVRSLLVEEEAFAAADELLNELFHQGGFVCTAAPAILPFLVEAAGSPRVPCRPAVLEIIALLAGTAAEVAPRWLAPEWPRAWTRARPGLLALLADENPAVRAAAIQALGDDGDDPDEVARALLARWPDPDVSVRTDTLLALGHLAGRLSAAVLPETLIFLREQADGPDVHHAMDAALALAKALPGRPIRPAPIIAGLTAEPVAPPHVAERVLYGLDGPGGDAVRLALLASPDRRLRAAAVSAAGDTLTRRRVPGLLTAVRGCVGGLDDPARALAILAAHARREDATDADLMAAHLDGPAAYIALWGLAWSGDDRAVPRLARLLTGRKTGFPLHTVHAERHRFWPREPSLGELLRPCAPWAGSLVPVIAPHLRPGSAGDFRRALLETLATWAATRAADVAGVVPELTALLDHDDRALAARVLGEIGPGAAPAVPGLERLLGAGDGGAAVEIAWAHFRVTGDPGPALHILGPRLGDDHHVARRLGDLGPHAAAHVPTLRLLAGSGDDWTAHEAAHALLKITGEGVHALMRPVSDLLEGRPSAVAPAAARALTGVGELSRGHLAIIRAVLADDRRHSDRGGVAAISEDLELRALLAERLRQEGGTRPARPAP
ncbi:HEAT repeat domain-containing protein [Herbidospora cretacea]|uniref:HEAT repeat domain-containing protein n=1 Tax=Herbidospora cretacea TaxID=28444 RepID=UPI0004C41698|nr:HEAT repeat domain-containing protein [Herbidospora cretacea]